MNLKKLKPYAVTGGTALAAVFLLNTLAKRNSAVAKVRSTINNGV